jgi:hypothetical protein
MSAKDAALQKTGSHYISDDVSSQNAEGIGKEEVFLYFSAKWRGKPVSVTMHADRYAARYGDTGNKLTPWRVYAQEAHLEDPERNGGRGEPVSGTARAALSKLCEPMTVEWLATDAYTASFQTAVAHTIMRKFHDEYRATRSVTEALATFKTRLAPPVYQAISDALEAWQAFEAAKAQAFDAIKVAAELEQLAQAVSA